MLNLQLHATKYVCLSKSLSTLIISLIFSCSAIAQTTDAPAWFKGELPDTDISYEIQVQVDLENGTYSGKEIVTWKNSAGKVDYLPIHLYLNAFSNMLTTWRSERFLRAGGGASFLKQFSDPWGYVHMSSVQIVGQEQELEYDYVAPNDGNHLDRSLVHISLPKTLDEGETIKLAISFEGKMPKPVARTGCVKDYCLFGQWFPKIAMRARDSVDDRGNAKWDARQFHGPTEFYSEFADYRVTIISEPQYLVAATGEQVAESTLDNGKKSVTFAQDAVHDFAFTIGDLVKWDTMVKQPGPGPDVKVSFVTVSEANMEPDEPFWNIEQSIVNMAKWVGPYPYKTLTLVYPPYRARETAGMEYPTFITGDIGDVSRGRYPENEFHSEFAVDSHEYGHQYFYGILASNEQDEALLDEGFNSYWDNKLADAAYGEEVSYGRIGKRDANARERSRLGILYQRHWLDQEAVWKRPASLFKTGYHGRQIYTRPAVIFDTAERLFGLDKITDLFRTYYKEWGFKHPQFTDFLDIAKRDFDIQLHDFLFEAFSTALNPDYKVVSVSSRKISLTEGYYLFEKDQVTKLTQEQLKENVSKATSPLTKQSIKEGKVAVQVINPGITTVHKQEHGSKYWVYPELDMWDTSKQTGENVYISSVEFAGPAYSHLPVAIKFWFEDGSQLNLEWDGKTTRREYKLYSSAKLKKVAIDPEQQIQIDYDPANNTQVLAKDQQFIEDWTDWMGAKIALWAAILTQI